MRSLSRAREQAWERPASGSLLTGTDWLPALDRSQLDEPDPVGASAWQTTDGRTLYGRGDGGTFLLWSPAVATFSFAAEGPVAYACDDETEARRLWMRSALPLALEARGLPVLHASAVHAGHSCVVVCGRSGAGKSTLAASAHREGLAVVADDAIAIALGEPPAVLTLPFVLRPRGHGELPVRGDGGEEWPLHQLLLLEPDPAAQSPSLEPLGAAEAFGALMPHAYCFSLEDSQERLVGEYTRLVEQTPAARLRYRHEPASLPGMVDVLRRLLA